MNCTKGEWKVNTINGVRVQTKNKFICLLSDTDDEDEIIANAHLIAAAPEMYEALTKIVAEGTRCIEITQQDRPVRDIYNIDEVDRIARQALAKAEVKE